MSEAPKTFEEAFDAIASEVLRLANDCLDMAIGHALPIDMHEYLADVAEIMAWLRERLWPGRSPLSWARARYWERRPETDSMWTQLAAHALLGLSIADGQEPDVCLRSLRELMVAKQKDYSPSNILDFGQLGCLVRANDKVRRLEHLLRHRQAPRNESIRDSWADLTNYAIIARMVRRGWFALPLAEAEEEGEAVRRAA